MHLNDWALDDIKKQMRNMSIYEIQQLYIKKQEEYSAECGVLVKLMGTGREDKQDELCNLLQMEYLVIAMKIADTLTGR